MIPAIPSGNKIFPYEILVKNKADGSKYPFVLMSDFVYRWHGDGRIRPYDICVPAGYETDFASIPRPFQGVFSAVNDVAPAALAHDWCYSTEIFGRGTCDQIFYDALRANGVGWLRAKTLWSAVRIGGWTSWPHNTAERRTDLALGREARARWECRDPSLRP